MMVSCHKATQLMSQQLDRKLTRGESVTLRFHLFMCSGCTNFRNNMHFLRRTCARVVAGAKADDAERADGAKGAEGAERAEGPDHTGRP